MSQEEELRDLSAHCRVCLQVPEATELLDLSIIYDEEEQLSYNDCFKICTDINLSAEVGLPHNLCKSCGVEMQMAYDFYKKVEGATHELRRWHEETEAILAAKHINEETQTEELVVLEEINSTDIKDELLNEIELENNAICDTNIDDNLIMDMGNVEDESNCEMTVEQLENMTEYDEEEHLELDEFHPIEMLEEEDAETLQTSKEEKSTVLEYLYDSITLSDDNDGQELINCDGEDNYDDGGSNYADEKQYKEIQNKYSSQLTNAIASASDNSGVRKRYVGKSTCDCCNKEFPNHSRMMLHRKCHETDRPKYACEQCGRLYITKQAMEAHVRTIHTKTGHTCPICHKIYPIKKCLEVHMRFHTGDFPYICEICGRKFAQICHLKTHKNVKHNNVRFSCDYPDCGKYFTSSASLRNHEFSHSVMPFECSFCQRGYPAKAKLKVHIKRKHGKDLTLDELEPMRRFQVIRSKLSLVKVVQAED